MVDPSVGLRGLAEGTGGFSMYFLPCCNNSAVSGFPDGVTDGVAGGVAGGVTGGVSNGVSDGVPDGVPDGVSDGVPDGVPRWSSPMEFPDGVPRWSFLRGFTHPAFKRILQYLLPSFVAPLGSPVGPPGPQCGLILK